jgi:hypothetical protein
MGERTGVKAGFKPKFNFHSQFSYRLLRTDVLSRVKTSAARREQLLDEFERSSCSVENI